MSYYKAQELLRLASISASRHRGVSVKDIVEEFRVNERTAQRMLFALQEVFPSLAYKADSDRRRWWKLHDTALLGKQSVYGHELVALEMGIRRARREGAESEAASLEAVRDRLMAALPSNVARRTESDVEAVLEAKGYACRPGPKVKVSPLVINIIAAALKGPYRLVIWYQNAHDAAPRERTIEPYGLLLGTRHYLIARDPAKAEDFRRFRVDRVSKAQITNEWFAMDKDFDLEAYAAQSFGSFHQDAEFTRIVWRFSPAAAVTAREFEFHPKQEMVDQDDGGLIVSFEASGLVEMAWHLYKWGDGVEVIEPPALRDMVAGWQNHRISVLP